MMDHKPLITYGGDVGVFGAAVSSLEKGMGLEAVEWKRAYGRSTKHVHLHPEFIPFKEELSPSSKGDDTLTSLLDQSMLHTFWTDCPDVEAYRATTKDQIQAWLTAVKTQSVKEWLIIVVEPPDHKKTNKLLPRSSVLDKVKGDFAQKQTERCVGLSDPLKLDSKSAESLHSCLHRIRQLLLSSYSKTLTKFEENMRAQREKRNEPGWNFCNYFLLQEELAFVLEMLNVYDEALVQYDELDALFTQFVLNSHLTDTPQWLLSFQRFGDRWPALTLSPSSSSTLLRIRDTIQNSSVSLLNFRNYLFARQALLLTKQRRFNELAQRSLAFLHNCINELGILDVSFCEEGSISAWVFVSSLEILGAISNSNNSVEIMENPVESTTDQAAADATDDVPHKKKGHKRPQAHLQGPISDFSVHTASLWDYAREKLLELGKLCGLLPKSELKSDFLDKVLRLSEGLNSFNDSITISESIKRPDEQLTLAIALPGGESPIEKLKNALSSKEKFQHNYLELCELAMGTYKHIGRLRSARRVGLSLAWYYMETKDYIKAIVFLSDAYKTFKDDKWSPLIVDVLFKLAQSYQAIGDVDRYIRTCAQISCSKGLDEEIRNHYFDEMMNALTNITTKDRFVMSSSEETFSIRNVQVESDGKIRGLDCPLVVNVELESRLPRPVVANWVEMAILPCDHTPKQFAYSTAGAVQLNDTSNVNKNAKKHGANPRRKDSGGENENLAAKVPVTRKESAPPIITCEDEDNALQLLEMNPALSVVDFRLQMDSGGATATKGENPKDKFQAGRLVCHNPHPSLRRKDSTQVKNEGMDKSDFTEVAKTQDVVINPGKNLITLQAHVSSAGCFRLAQVSIGVKHFELLSPRLGCRYRFSVSRESPTIGVDATNLVAGIEQEIIIKVETGSYFITENMTLQLRSSLGLTIREGNDSEFATELALPLPKTSPFSTAHVTLVIKAQLGSQKDSTVIEHKLIAKCPWTSEERRLGLALVPPFVSSHKLHSVGQRKFLQVSLVGNSDAQFSLTDHELTAGVPLVGLNPKSQSLNLGLGRTAAYMWEIGVQEFEDEQPLRLEFSVKFQAKGHSPEEFKYYICLQKFKTQFELSSHVDPHKGTEFCRVGNMCTMVINIKRRAHKNTLMYEVRADQHMWAICGRSSGVVSGEEEGDECVSLDVMPMCPGYLPLPTVHLSKYIPADQKGSTGSSGVPKLEPFNTGQVYNGSKGVQVHVLPPPQPLGGSCGPSLSSGGNSLPISTADHF